MLVFALFHAEVRIIDNSKRAALSRLLLDSVLSIDAGEKLDEKLASMALPANFSDRKYISLHERCY
jgi:hypothetical protein